MFSASDTYGCWKLSASRISRHLAWASVSIPRCQASHGFDRLFALDAAGLWEALLSCINQFFCTSSRSLNALNLKNLLASVMSSSLAALLQNSALIYFENYTFCVTINKF
ncbi:hypothetical protein J6590_015067 [Homalodisca vitripennis]|nr:hypothetical protein J6590_015067 [Homalodisca vitripennis]